MRCHVYALVPTEAQHRHAMKRLLPFSRCLVDVSRAGLAAAKPVSCFGPGNRLRFKAMKRVTSAAKKGETIGRDILARVTALCEITNALGEVAAATEALLCAGASDEAGSLVVDEAEAAKVRAAVAWAQDLARRRQGEMGEG